jgi:hypothetical protein
VGTTEVNLNISLGWKEMSEDLFTKNGEPSEVDEAQAVKMRSNLIINNIGNFFLPFLD